MDKTKLEQPVPFEDTYFRRSEGGPPVIVLEKPTPMSDANYRQSRQVDDSEQALSFTHLIERYSIAEGTSEPSNSQDMSEIRLTPKGSSTGPEGTVYYDSDDDHLYVGTE